MLLLYKPETLTGWLLHTLFYVFGIIFVIVMLVVLSGPETPSGEDALMGVITIFAVPIGITLLIIQRLARRIALRSETSDDSP